MHIGITERGDAGIDFAWVSKVNTVDAMILITKNVNKKFSDQVLALYKQGVKIVIHCTCTGWGGSIIEPYVPDYKTQLNNINNLIKNGFPANNVVLRVDPIFPSEKGIKRIKEVLDYFYTLNTGITRIRISLVDEYRHVKARYYEHNLLPLYGDKFYPSHEQKKLVADVLNAYSAQYGFVYELCAEDNFHSYLNNSEIIGCVSNKDLMIFGLPEIDMTTNLQNRNGCHCLSCKKELLTNRKQCPHNCLYCYWK